LLNASVGIQRVLGRLHRPGNDRASSATHGPRRSLAVQHVRHGLHSVAAASRLVPARDTRSNAVRVAAPTRRSFFARLGPDRAVAIAVAGVLIGASIVSVSAGAPAPAPATGGTTGDGQAPRIAIGGDLGSDVGNDVGNNVSSDVGGDVAGAVGTQPDAYARGGNVQFAEPPPATTATSGFEAIDFGDVEIAASQPINVEGPFIDDGTLIKPVAVDTTVPDGSALVRTYTVKANDTLAGIATQFGVSMMTVWWANNLKSKNDLHKGQVLRIPPVTGLIVKVNAADTLDGLATRYGTDSTDILATNGLSDPNLVVGQVLVIPGAKGAAIPVSKPQAKPPIRVSSGGGGGGSARPPISYTGGKFIWPVVGGGNYISQYFHYGHYAIDIAADYGSTVRAAAAGTVTFAGWKNNGGGYQVWVAHGSGLYTTYNHMSSLSVGRGQHVDRGQRVGRVGQSGNATGPHLHFEVWRGPVWDGGQRVNPLAYF
jgi:murein DD-endopeptidase MepM/ murein hydrolase activator NlpD